MWMRILHWFCPALAERLSEVPQAVPCDSMDFVRQHARELIDGLEAAAEQGRHDDDQVRLTQLDALAGYLEGELQRFRTRYFSE